jgi:hypothetical protein
MTLGNIAKYALTQFPKSRDCSNLVVSLATLAREYDIHTIASLKIAPLGELFRNWSEFESGRTILADWSNFYIVACECSASKSDATVKKVFASFGRAVVSSSVALKWIATVGGVVVLSSHTKLFGHVKNMTSFCLACVSLNDAYAKVKKEKKITVISALDITATVCSLFLIGIGGLDSYIGKQPFIDKGLQRVSPATFATVAIFAGSIKIVKTIL